MFVRRLSSLALLVALLSPLAAAQGGSQRVLGGGCANRTAPNVSGTLTIGSNASIDSPGCFLGQGGFGLLLIGTALPQAQWIPIGLRSSFRGIELCDLVLLPDAFLDVTTIPFPISVTIPNDPLLRGASVTLQTLCTECGFAGCFDLLTQALELTFA